MSFAFDEAYYLAQNPDVAAAIGSGAGSSALNHYLLFGSREGRAPSAVAADALAHFSEFYYLEANPDVAAAVRTGAIGSGLQHYLLYGGREGRDLYDRFDETAYRTDNPDVASAISLGFVQSGAEHYFGFGRFEGRLAKLVGSDQQGPNVDRIYVGGDGRETIEAGNGKTVIFARGDNDTLIGGPTDDRLYGEIGNDTIAGGAGNDRIVGGPGGDTMTGGPGADVFSFDARPGANGAVLGAIDVITDFDTREDKLEFAYVTEAKSRSQIAAEVGLNFVKPPADPVARTLAIADFLADASRTDNAVVYGDFEGDTYVLFERVGVRTSFDSSTGIIVKLVGVGGDFSFDANLVATFAG